MVGEAGKNISSKRIDWALLLAGLRLLAGCLLLLLLLLSLVVRFAGENLEGDTQAFRPPKCRMGDEIRYSASLCGPRMSGDDELSL